MKLRPTRTRDHTMKLFLKITLVLTSIFGVIILSSCEKDEVGTIVEGKVVATPSIVKNGDEIAFKIGGNYSMIEDITINGKDYHPIIHYLIDGKEVVISSETTLPFNAKYTIKDLTIGEHILSVDITSSREGGIFENEVSSTIITILE